MNTLHGRASPTATRVLGERLLVDVACAASSERHSMHSTELSPSAAVRALVSSPQEQLLLSPLAPCRMLCCRAGRRARGVSRLRCGGVFHSFAGIHDCTYEHTRTSAQHIHQVLRRVSHFRAPGRCCLIGRLYDTDTVFCHCGTRRR